MQKPQRPALLTSLVAGLVIAGLAVGPAAADPISKPGFYRAFPGLPGFTAPTQQQIADLAQHMLDPNAAGDDTGNDELTSGYTYFGQFLDHDLTLDASPPPLAPVDPTTLTNSRTFALDLDSVYGAGPGSTDSGGLYDTRGRFLLADPNVNGVLDYVRLPDGSAIIPEARNDENRIIAQIQLAMMKAHNRLIDAGLSFQDARRTLVSAYQEAVTGDFLPATLAPGITLDSPSVKQLDPKKTGTPIEFSVAAYRFGHSQVRKAYVLNEQSGKVQVFSLTAPDLRGGSPLPANLKINWGEFFDGIPLVDTDGNPINMSRKIDTLISTSLFVLPIPGAEATGSNVLAFRNMSRAVFYALPSGQDVAAALGQPVTSPATLNLGPGFETGTPLWYYILDESARMENGNHLGPTGSIIVAAGFRAALQNGDKAVKGKVNTAQLDLFRNPATGEIGLDDLFIFAGVASR